MTRPDTAQEQVAERWALRCANGDLHAERGEVLTAEDARSATDAAAFMDDDLDDSPWQCGPHEAVRHG